MLETLTEATYRITHLLNITTKEMAYLDPGSGSYLIQLLIAGLLGAAFAVRMSWSRIKSFFRRLLGKPEADDEFEE
jgi:hypothetical protein